MEKAPFTINDGEAFANAGYVFIIPFVFH